MPITEEVGVTFDDGHWNRHDTSPLFTVEAQAVLKQLKAHEITDELMPLVEAEQAVSKEDRARLALASLWYWRADAETDRIVRYISWWIVIESIEMSTSDPSPVKKRLLGSFRQTREFGEA